MRTREPNHRSDRPDFRYGIRVPTKEPRQPPSDFTLRLSQHLRDYMDEKDLSVQRLATALGRSRNYVYDHTNGHAAPDTNLLDKVAELTGTDARSLMMILIGRMGITRLTPGSGRTGTDAH